VLHNQAGTGQIKKKGGALKIKLGFTLFVLLFLASCKSPEQPGVIKFEMMSGPTFKYIHPDIKCEGSVKNAGTALARNCVIYITIRNKQLNTLATISGYLDPHNVSPGQWAGFTIVHNDPQATIWNQLDVAATFWEVRYDR